MSNTTDQDPSRTEQPQLMVETNLSEIEPSTSSEHSSLLVESNEKLCEMEELVGRLVPSRRFTDVRQAGNKPRNHDKVRQPLQFLKMYLEHFDAPPASALGADMLEHIVTFLPEEYVSIMKLVCKTWDKHIGTTSPYLWKLLLHRRNWPVRAIPDITTDEETRVCKEAYTSHYSAVRNSQAIHKTMQGFISEDTDHRELVLAKFKEPDRCVGSRVVANNLVLAAFEDCTLRLFKAFTNSDGGKVCAELSRLDLSTFLRTKGESVSLGTMCVDDDLVLCLLRRKRRLKPTFVAVTLEKLVCEGRFSSTVAPYISVVDVDQVFRTFLQQLVGEEDQPDAVIVRGDDFVGCGTEAVFVAVTLHYRQGLAYRDGRRLALISFKEPVVAWQERLVGYHTGCTRLQQPHSDSGICSILLGDIDSVKVSVYDVMMTTPPAVSSRVLRGEMNQTAEDRSDNMEVRCCNRCMVSTPTDTVALEVLLFTEHGNVFTSNEKYQVSFLPNREIGNGTISYSLPVNRIEFDGEFTVGEIHDLGDNHVLILLVQLVTQEDGRCIVVHVPTRKIVDEAPLANVFRKRTLDVSSLGNTIAVSWDYALILTGHDIRSVGKSFASLPCDSSSEGGKKRKHPLMSS